MNITLDMAYRACKHARITRDEPGEAEVAAMQRRLQWFVDEYATTKLDLTAAALNRAAGELPGRWTIEIQVEREAGNVCLYDEEGTEHEYPCNRESVAQDVIDALDYAIDQYSGRAES
jgi:hypothetical protein